MTITPRERDVIAAIRHLTMLHLGQPPTRIELGRELGISGVSAHLHVARLRDKGILRVESRRHRGVWLTRRASRATSPPAGQSAGRQRRAPPAPA